jgi:hypothetical protein
MGLVSDFAVIGGIACAAVYAAARILALLIVLRGTKPEERAELVRAVAELFRRAPQAGHRALTIRRHQQPTASGQQAVPVDRSDG